MQLHDLKPAKGAHRRPDRVGRGTGSGRGKTSGRGQKGQNARSEGFRLGFEGGQMPLSQRLPKLPGFKNRFKKIYAVVNVSKLSRFADGAKVDAEALQEAGLVKGDEQIKILGAGRIKRRLTVEAHAFSNSAREAIEKAGGTVTVLGKKADEAEEAEEPAPAE
ncbi:MAG TPA: 50S ribosomal protein L15 [Candidatus Dormibacteraeota bacterium]|nr:50S ribosomal protein L15 [Candidatus Dormibacteraeota bacterium]